MEDSLGAPFSTKQHLKIFLRVSRYSLLKMPESLAAALKLSRCLWGWGSETRKLLSDEHKTLGGKMIPQVC